MTRSLTLMAGFALALAGCASHYEEAHHPFDTLHGNASDIASTYGCEAGFVDTGGNESSTLVVELTCPAGEAADAAAMQLSLAAMAEESAACEAGETEQLLLGDGTSFARTHLSCRD